MSNIFKAAATLSMHCIIQLGRVREQRETCSSSSAMGITEQLDFKIMVGDLDCGCDLNRAERDSDNEGTANSAGADCGKSFYGPSYRLIVIRICLDWRRSSKNSQKHLLKSL